MQVIAKRVYDLPLLVDHMTRRHEVATYCVADPYRRAKKLGSSVARNVGIRSAGRRRDVRREVAIPKWAESSAEVAQQEPRKSKPPWRIRPLKTCC